MALNAENEAELKKFSLYRECKIHNWHGIKQIDGPELFCKDCQITKLTAERNRARAIVKLVADCKGAYGVFAMIASVDMAARETESY
jgi:hypothetical protein